jgi:dihydrofolate reductase
MNKEKHNISGLDISIIVAMDQNRGIGFDNKIPWYIPEDLKRFKKLTIHNTVVMGRKTWFSLPFRPLKDRTNIVLTRSTQKDLFEGSLITNNVDEIFRLMDKQKENFIIGGYRLYETFLPYANKLYLTIVHNEFEVDTYFPDIEINEWSLISMEDFLNAPIPYSNYIYQKNEKKNLV